MATAVEQKLVEEQSLSLMELEDMGVRYIGRIGNAIKLQISKYVSDQGIFGVRKAIDRSLVQFYELILDATVAGYIQAKTDVVFNAADRLGDSHIFLSTPYSEAIDFVKAKMGLSADQIEDLRKEFGDQAIEVTRNLGDVAELAAREAMQEIVESGTHVRGGIKKLHEKLDKAGITAQKKHVLETLVRTQVQMSYSAGRWSMLQDPDIQSMLWGFEYSAVGDARTRANHEALDGVTFKKDDQQLSTLWPPNGYNCRCTMLEHYEEPDPQKPLPDTVDIDGVEVLPKPDVGWDFNPGEVIHSKVSLPELSASAKRKFYIGDNVYGLQQKDFWDTMHYVGKAQKAVAAGDMAAEQKAMRIVTGRLGKKVNMNKVLLVDDSGTILGHVDLVEEALIKNAGKTEYKKSVLPEWPLRRAKLVGGGKVTPPSPVVRPDKLVKVKMQPTKPAKTKVTEEIIEEKSFFGSDSGGWESRHEKFKAELKLKLEKDFGGDPFAYKGAAIDARVDLFAESLKTTKPRKFELVSIGDEVSRMPDMDTWQKWVAAKEERQAALNFWTTDFEQVKIVRNIQNPGSVLQAEKLSEAMLIKHRKTVDVLEELIDNAPGWRGNAYRGGIRKKSFVQNLKPGEEVKWNTFSSFTTELDGAEEYLMQARQAGVKGESVIWKVRMKDGAQITEDFAGNEILSRKAAKFRVKSKKLVDKKFMKQKVGGSSFETEVVHRKVWEIELEEVIEKTSKKKVQPIASKKAEKFRSQATFDADRVQGNARKSVEKKFKKRVDAFGDHLENFANDEVVENFNNRHLVTEIYDQQNYRANCDVRWGKVKLSRWDNRETAFHEMGHLIESDQATARKAVAWVRKRGGGVHNKTTYGKIVSWTNDKNFAAYKDRFISTYVGKLYREGYTEVISVGMQQFATKRKMLAFAKKDFDHFSFILGILQGVI